MRLHTGVKEAAMKEAELKAQFEKEVRALYPDGETSGAERDMLLELAAAQGLSRQSAESVLRKCLPGVELPSSSSIPLVDAMTPPPAPTPLPPVHLSTLVESLPGAERPLPPISKLGVQSLLQRLIPPQHAWMLPCVVAPLAALALVGAGVMLASMWGDGEEAPADRLTTTIQIVGTPGEMPGAAPGPQAKVEPRPEPVSAPRPELTPEPAPEPKPEPVPEPKPEPTPEPPTPQPLGAVELTLIDERPMQADLKDVLPANITRTTVDFQLDPPAGVVVQVPDALEKHLRVSVNAREQVIVAKPASGFGWVALAKVVLSPDGKRITWQIDPRGIEQRPEYLDHVVLEVVDARGAVVQQCHKPRKDVNQPLKLTLYDDGTVESASVQTTYPWVESLKARRRGDKAGRDVKQGAEVRASRDGSPAAVVFSLAVKGTEVTASASAPTLPDLMKSAAAEADRENTLHLDYNNAAAARYRCEATLADKRTLQKTLPARIDKIEGDLAKLLEEREQVLKQLKSAKDKDLIHLLMTKRDDLAKMKINMERQRMALLASAKDLPGEIAKLEQDLPKLENKRDETHKAWIDQKKKLDEVVARAKEAEDACKGAVLEVVDAWGVPVLLAPLEIVRARTPKKN